MRPLRERVLEERDRQRRLADAEADREAMARNAHGRSWASSPVDLTSRSQDPFARRGEKSITVEGTPPPTRSPTVTLSGQADQAVDGVSDDVLFSGKAGEPRDEQWFDVTTPTTQVTVPLSGRLWLDVDWRWGLLADPSDGRFRCPVHLRVTRTRDGVTDPVDYQDPQVAPGGRVTDPGWSVERGDVLTFRLLHDAGAERTLGKFTVGLTEVETQVSVATPAATAVLAIDETRPYLYELDSDGTVLSTVDLSATFPDGLFGAGWDGTGLWVQDQGGSDLHRISTAGAILSTVTGPGYGPVVYLGGSLWHADPFSATVTEVDPADGSTLSSFSGPNSGGHFGITTDGTSLWLGKGETVWQVSTAGTLQATVSLDVTAAEFDVYALGWLDGQLLVADSATSGGQATRVVDPSDGSVVDTWALPAGANVLSGLVAT